ERRRAGEEEPRLLLPVRLVQRELDLHCLVAERSEVLQRLLQHAVETAADLACPAQQQHELLLVEADAGLVLLEALHVDDAVSVQVFEPGRERLLDLPLRHAFQDRDVGVHVHFHSHGVVSRGDGRAFYHAPSAESRPSAAVNGPAAACVSPGEPKISCRRTDPTGAAMNVMYNSENYYVVEYPGRRGVELVDKTTGRAGFLEGAVEIKVRASMQHLA